MLWNCFWWWVNIKICIYVYWYNFPLQSPNKPWTWSILLFCLQPRHSCLCTGAGGGLFTVFSSEEPLLALNNKSTGVRLDASWLDVLLLHQRLVRNHKCTQNIIANFTAEIIPLYPIRLTAMKQLGGSLSGFNITVFIAHLYDGGRVWTIL